MHGCAVLSSVLDFLLHFCVKTKVEINKLYNILQTFNDNVPVVIGNLIRHRILRGFEMADYEISPAKRGIDAQSGSLLIK